MSGSLLLMNWFTSNLQCTVENRYGNSRHAKIVSMHGFDVLELACVFQVRAFAAEAAGRIVCFYLDHSPAKQADGIFQTGE